MDSRVRRGQVLVIAALAISLTILTTQMYLYSLSARRIDAENDYLSDYILSLEQGTKNVAIASLANITSGGATSVLEENMNRWEVFTSGDYRYGKCSLNLTMESENAYTDGIWQSWGISGTGYSSASVTIGLGVNGKGVEVCLSSTINITTKITATASYTALGGNSKQIEVAINLSNEALPASASTISVEYNKTTIWEDASSLGDYSETDYGNGTYKYRFTDDVTKTQIPVRVRVTDRRGIIVQTETLAEES